jgi:hypothetical protein
VVMSDRESGWNWNGMLLNELWIEKKESHEVEMCDFEDVQILIDK